MFSTVFLSVKKTWISFFVFTRKISAKEVFIGPLEAVNGALDSKRAYRTLQKYQCRNYQDSLEQFWLKSGCFQMKIDRILNWNDPNNYYAWENRFGLLIAFRQFHFSASFCKLNFYRFPFSTRKCQFWGENKYFTQFHHFWNFWNVKIESNKEWLGQNSEFLTKMASIMA